MRSLRGLMTVLVLLGTSSCLPAPTNGCIFAVGYFYQVTALRGRVVGAHLGLLQEIGPLRRAFARKHATLTLYRYHWPIDSNARVQIVKTVETDSRGRFDFGAVPPGHYRLLLDGEKNFSGAFDVEVRRLPQPTDYVTIDISPVFPDCSGGHTFVVKTR